MYNSCNWFFWCNRRSIFWNLATDIDECAMGQSGCDPHASCINTEGSFSCQCASGYRGNGIKCTDIDECIEGSHSCDASAVCNNKPGSYVCSCKCGFILGNVSADGQQLCQGDITFPVIASCRLDIYNSVSIPENFSYEKQTYRLRSALKVIAQKCHSQKCNYCVDYFT